MKLNKVFALMLALVMILALVTGCASGGQNTSNSTNVKADSAAADEKLQFAIVYPVIHEFFNATTEGAENTAAEIGNIEILAKGSTTGDVQQQIEIMENLITMGVDGIAIGCTDSDALTPVINKAIEKGIQVVSFDTDAPDSNRAGYIGTDNFSAGQHMGRVAAELLDGKGKVLISTGTPSQLGLNQRIEGVKDVFTAYPDIEIVDIQPGYGDAVKTLSNIEDMIKAHPDFSILLGMDAPAGPAAVTAWKAQGLEQPIVAFDDMADVIQGLKDGQITATIAQGQYDWGVNIVKELKDLVDGKEIPANQDTGTREINQENVREYYPDEG